MSRLAEMQARFQQKQIQEREEKLLRLYESQQQRAFDRVNRGSAGSNTSVGSTGGGGGKVRQMFDERRQKAGVDKSYPLEPLKKTMTNGRGASLDRVNNSSSTNRTVIKSTVQKSVSQVRNGKPPVNKREVVHSIYNNNNGVESFETHRFEDDDNDFTRFTSNNKRDLVEMMNNHNLRETLDDEEMPQIGFDEPDEGFFAGKLANVGGRLPSESVAEKSKTGGTTLGKTFRKDTKPIVKRTIRTVASPPQGLNSSPSVQSQPSKPVSIPPVATAKTSNSQTMSSKKAAVAQPTNSARAPCNQRPSAKQSAKSAVTRDDLNECRYCNRRFAADRVTTHEAICGKTAKKKRKTYDATKHRVEGTELEQYTRKGKTLSNKPSGKQQAAKKDWRRTHEEFINAIRAAKQAQAHVAKGGKLSDLPPPPPSSNPDYVQCPHCNRKFNETAAERHIPKCSSFQFNKPKPGAAKGKAPSGKK